MKLNYTNGNGERVVLSVASTEAAQDIINENFLEGVEMSDINIEHDDVESFLKVFQEVQS